MKTVAEFVKIQSDAASTRQAPRLLQAPTEEYLDYGNEIKTGKSFRKNIEAIVGFAEETHSPVLLIPFVYRISEDYTREKYKAGELDYRKSFHNMEAENWGHPQNIARTIDLHNKALREIAKNYKHVILVDLNKTFPRNKTTFSDLCHLTDKGITEFVERIISSLKNSSSWKGIP